jgi:hypothetical protein
LRLLASLYYFPSGKAEPERNGKGEPELGGTGEPELTGMGDPELKGTGDPELSGAGKPELRGMGDPKVRGEGETWGTSSITNGSVRTGTSLARRARKVILPKYVLEAKGQKVAKVTICPPCRIILFSLSAKRSCSSEFQIVWLF